MSRYRGIITNNIKMSLTVVVRRSIDLRELGDFGSIADEAADLPTAGAAHRKATGSSISATRRYSDLSTVTDQTVVDRQDMGLITETPTGVLGYNNEPYLY